MPEDVFPIGYGPSLNELMKMEGDYAFTLDELRGAVERINRNAVSAATQPHFPNPAITLKV